LSISDISTLPRTGIFGDSLHIINVINQDFNQDGRLDLCVVFSRNTREVEREMYLGLVLQTQDDFGTLH
jgi:hypothetical protein